MGCVGNTAAITMTGPNWSFAGRVTEIGGLHEFIAVLDDSDLSVTAQRKYCPGEIIGRDPVAVSARIKSGVELPGIKEAGTIQITFPLAPGSTNPPTTPANLIGSGFVHDRVSPTFADDELLVCTFEVMFDGDATNPVYSPEIS